jgi:FAD/FMN-containing dehydrogenase
MSFFFAVDSVAASLALFARSPVEVAVTHVAEDVRREAGERAREGALHLADELRQRGDRTVDVVLVQAPLAGEALADASRSDHSSRASRPDWLMVPSWTSPASRSSETQASSASGAPRGSTSTSTDSFHRQCQATDEVLFSLVRKYAGSISAEHGIGLLKKHALGYSRSPAELSLFRALKRALDPKGLLNPGEIFD